MYPWFQDSNTVPSKKIKTDNNSAHPDATSQQQQMLNSNHQEKEDSEPPVDFSTTNSTKTLRKQDSSERSPSREEMLPVKSEPPEGVGGGGCEPDDSNESTVISEPQILTAEPDDSALVPSVGVQNYFDSKLFAVAGASFNFSMAAALAADSLAGS